MALVVLVVAAVGLGILRGRADDGVPSSAEADAAAPCGIDDPGCPSADALPTANTGAPTAQLEASTACYGAGYLCAGLDGAGELRVLRWNDDTEVIRVLVGLPDLPDRGRAQRLQEAAARGIRAWHERPFPLRVDYSDRSGDHDIVVRWVPVLGKGELGRTGTRWIRRDGRADLHVQEFSLSVQNPWDPSRPIPPEQVELTAAHEMGHALGLPHSNDTRDVMYPENTATRLTARDFATMTRLYELENGAVIR